MDLKKNFKVISKGNFIAGMRSPGHGSTIQLTDTQAEYPLLMGEIEAADKPAPVAAPAAVPEKPSAPATVKDKS